MTAETGHFALILAFCLALGQASLPLIGALSHRRLWMATARPFAAGQFVFVALSFACLAAAFAADDFSVRYVATNSNTLLPWYYKISAVWGAHEGSLLLWVLILAGWSLAVAVFSRSLPLVLVARVLAVMGMIAVGFYSFLVFTSNPFERSLPFHPAEGSDLNPLLQDIGLILHPPMLYMGYVGFSVVFAFAIAALIGGRMDSAWARWARPWTNTAWAFLTMGIVLGSWWAYYELGWGGWWFWDPVENASFMPWLVGTALVHSLAATEKRGVFRSWTLLLAILAFSLSLLGTFLVRSGVLTSVHAFAADPTRGLFILIFLGVVIGGSLLLYGARSARLSTDSGFDWLSREMFLLLNNVLLVVVAGVILVGTLYPLIADVFGWGSISVGPPYFNLFFVPLMGLLALVMAVGAIARWKRTGWSQLRPSLVLPAIASGLLAIAVPLVLGWPPRASAVIAIGLGIWVLAVSGVDLWRKSSHAQGRLTGLTRLRGSYYGMLLAHLGVAVTVVGVGITSQYSEQRDVRLAPGERVSVGGHEFSFAGIHDVDGPNYRAQVGTIEVFRNGQLETVLHPQKRRYLASGQVMTEAGIDGALSRDIYVALGEPLSTGAWAVRVYVKPCVRWIWLGGIMIAAGGMLAMLDKRYRHARALAPAAASAVSAV